MLVQRSERGLQSGAFGAACMAKSQRPVQKHRRTGSDRVQTMANRCYLTVLPTRIVAFLIDWKTAAGCTHGHSFPHASCSVAHQAQPFSPMFTSTNYGMMEIQNYLLWLIFKSYCKVSHCHLLYLFRSSVCSCGCLPRNLAWHDAGPPCLTALSATHRTHQLYMPASSPNVVRTSD